MFAAIAHSLFGSHNDRVLKGFRKTVDQINALEPEIEKLSDTELGAQTAKFRKQLSEEGKTLDDLLPEAFATVREAARRTLEQRPFDVQLMGAIALHQGYIPEMRTGEGKTLTATLAVYLNALQGKGVHVVTVNDYLAQRDAAWMTPVFKMLDISVGYIISNLPDDMRRAAYAADVTYGTNNEFGFDYLRDNMKFDLKDMVQRSFNYAIVDEVDSILIDEARTPLIISGAVQDSAHMYEQVDRIIPDLVPDDYEIDEKHKSVILTDAGSLHAEEIMREQGILKDGGLYDAQNIGLVHHLNQALRAHKLFTRDVDYIVKDNAVIIVDEFTGRMMEGRRFSDGLHQALEARERVKIQNENQSLASITFQNYFRLYPKLAGMTGTALTEKDEFEAIYNLRVVEIPTNRPQVRLDEHDEVYRTAEEKYEAIIRLIEECKARKQPVLVGTTSIEKSENLSRRLKKLRIDHNVLNAKQHEHEAHIIAQAGKPGAVTIATNMAGRGTDIKLGGNLEMRIAAEIPETADAETRARLEAEIEREIAAASEEVKKAGGLYVVGSERHESRRIDNQLRGRSGRQGDPGASKFFISLEDDLMRIFGSEKMDFLLQKMGLQRGQPIIHPWINTAIERAQKKVESQHFDARKFILRFDNVMNDQRRVIYEERREIMNATDVSEIIVEMRHKVIEGMVENAIPEGTYVEQWDVQGLKTATHRFLGMQLPIDQWVHEDGIDATVIAGRITQEIDTRLAEKEKDLPQGFMRQLEKNILLQTLDNIWKEHLLNLDHLRQGVQLRAYGQKDPLNEYKAEAFALFQAMRDQLYQKVTSYLCMIEIHAGSEPPPLPRLRTPQKTVLSRSTEPQPASEARSSTPRPTLQVVFDQNDPSTWSRTPRNAACPCGSGKKYKYCHGQVSGDASSDD